MSQKLFKILELGYVICDNNMHGQQKSFFSVSYGTFTKNQRYREPDPLVVGGNRHDQDSTVYNPSWKYWSNELVINEKYN